MSSKELDAFLARSHKELSIQDFEGKGVPCIEFDGKRFDDILSKVAGKPLSVCLLYTSPSPRDATLSRMPSSA